MADLGGENNLTTVQRLLIEAIAGTALTLNHSGRAGVWATRHQRASGRGHLVLGASEPVSEFDRRPFEHPLLSSMDSAAQVGSADPGTR
jgi:hypothetical protein